MRREPTELELWAEWAWHNVPMQEYSDFMREKANQIEAKKMTAADLGLETAPHWLFEAKT